MARSPVRRLPATLGILLVITAGSVAVRLWELGYRVAHQDEGRVADWTIRYIQSGHWEYSPIIHGPFLPHVNGMLFPVIGANDFTARLIVALIGGVLPLAAWLFRTRLSNTEMIGMAAFLAINPVLVYYSRFMRNDVLLAAMAVFVVGFAVRGIDTGRVRYFHVATVLMALAFTTKENAVLYPLAWIGALALILDHRMLVSRESTATDRPRWGDRRWYPAWLRSGAGAAFRRSVARVLTRGWRWRWHLALAAIEFALVVVLFYAPLPDLWQLVDDPTRAPAVFEAATIENWRKFLGVWGNPDFREHSYLEFSTYYLAILQRFALPLLALGLLGFLWSRYGEEDRPLVDFAAYWGIASIVGYPLVMDIQAAWGTAHAIAPLSIPAGVGVGLFADRFVALDGDDRVDALLVGVFAAAGGLALSRVLGALSGVFGGTIVLNLTTMVSMVILVVLAVAILAYRRADPDRRPSGRQIVAGIAIGVLAVAAIQAGTTTYDTSFVRPQSAENAIVQYAQPSGLMQGTLAQIYAHADRNDGVDVMFYGDEDGQYCNQLVQPKEEWLPPESPPCGWFSRLPLPWYFSAHDVTTGSSTNASAVMADPPPVVIALSREAFSVSGNTASDLEGLTDQGYTRYEHEGYLWGRPFVFFVRESPS